MNYSYSRRLDALARQLATEAKAGHRESALELLFLARLAVSELRHVTRKHPLILSDACNGPAAPVMVRRGKPERWKSAVASAASKLGVELPKNGNEYRAGRTKATAIKSFAVSLFSELNSLRGPSDVNDFGTVQVGEDVIHKILTPKGWHPPIIKNGISITEVLPSDYIIKAWQGWNDAARFLPEPSLETSDVWWCVALACLKERFGNSWANNEHFLNEVGLESSALDKSSARASTGVQVQRAFEAAVKRASQSKKGR